MTDPHTIPHLPNPGAAVREINRLTRDGGNGLNVYVDGRGIPAPMRVTRARTRAGVLEVRVLLTRLGSESGEWLAVRESRRVFRSL